MGFRSNIEPYLARGDWRCRPVIIITSRLVSRRWCPRSHGAFIRRWRFNNAVCHCSSDVPGPPGRIRRLLAGPSSLVKLPGPQTDRRRSPGRSRWRGGRRLSNRCSSLHPRRFFSLLPRFLRLVERCVSIGLGGARTLVAVPPPSLELRHPSLALSVLHDKESHPLAGAQLIGLDVAHAQLASSEMPSGDGQWSVRDSFDLQRSKPAVTNGGRVVHGWPRWPGS